jgi:hypothetical protein
MWLVTGGATVYYPGLLGQTLRRRLAALRTRDDERPQAPVEGNG